MVIVQKCAVLMQVASLKTDIKGTGQQGSVMFQMMLR